MNQTPRPPKDKQKRPEGLVFAIGLVVIVLGFAVYGSFFMGEPEPPPTAAKPADEAPPYKSLTDTYSILENNPIGSGQYTNLVAIIGDTAAEGSDVLLLAGIIKRKECIDAQCNTIDIWKSKEAYYLYKNKSDSPKWRRKHWQTICESNLANYVVSAGELLLYPMLDTEYRRWGGKKKRPNISSYNLQ